VIEADDNLWLRLCASEDLVQGQKEKGAYYVRLEKGKPSQLVQWYPDSGVKITKQNIPETITFTGIQLITVKGHGSPKAWVARMVRQKQGITEEWLFTAAEDAEDISEIEILHNPQYKDLRTFKVRLENYPETLKGPEATFGSKKSTGFLLFMRNSFFISIMAVIGQILSSSLVAFGFSRLEFKGRDFLFVCLLATLMIPGQVTLIPLFTIYKKLRWIDTFLPLIVPHFTAGAFNVFLLRQYMLTIPKELDEAAAIDGCSAWKTYFHVILPNCVPVLIVVGLFTFVGTWQNVMGPLIYLDNPEYRTVTLGLEYFRSPYVDNRHLIMTGAVLAMLPVGILFLFLQKYIMSGIATTGIKG
jgi:ABC-type glycerol-3-phosphate transport system permease component